MLLPPLKTLPSVFQTEQIKPYYNLINKHRKYLVIRRILDILLSLIGIIITSPVFIAAFIGVKVSSKGSAFFLQERIGIYNKPFRIFKFRTMVVGAQTMGASITVGTSDPRITKFGRLLRLTRIDEMPQLYNILLGHMTMIGARPEVPKYVDKYTNEMMATLLLPPGLTGMASLRFKDENKLLAGKKDPEQYYIDEIIPIKMAINLEYLNKISFKVDLKMVVDTLKSIF